MKKIPTLHYMITGSGSPVVLLHGYLASSRYWQPTAEALSQNHQVIAIDLLGFGHSPKPACSKYDYAAQLASIDATLSKIGINEPFTLVGHSMGALLALRYASENEHRVKKLLLTNMPVFMSRTHAKQEIHGTNIFYQIGLRPGVHSIIWPLFWALMQLRLIPDRAVGTNAAAHRRYLFQNRSYSRMRSMRNVIFAAKVYSDIETLKVKTIIISGLQDRKSYFQGLAQLPHNKHVSLRNFAGGHHLPLTAPSLITQFV